MLPNNLWQKYFSQIDNLLYWGMTKSYCLILTIFFHVFPASISKHLGSDRPFLQPVPIHHHLHVFVHGIGPVSKLKNNTRSCCHLSKSELLGIATLDLQRMYHRYNIYTQVSDLDDKDRKQMCMQTAVVNKESIKRKKKETVWARKLIRQLQNCKI